MSQAPIPRARLTRHQRLTRSAWFEETYRQQRRWIGRLMVLWVRQGNGTALRLGVVAGRKVGQACARNRAKRLLREAFRRLRGRLRGEADVVLVARHGIAEAAWNEVERELAHLARRAGLTDMEA